MKNSEYRILKLKSGEEIITKIIGKRKNNKMVLERPMVFKSITISDEYGRKKEITVLKNWLSHSHQNTTTIPEDYIASFLKPNNLVTDLYELEKEKEDTGQMGPKKITGPAFDDFTKASSPKIPFPFPLPPEIQDEISEEEMSPEEMLEFLRSINDALDNMVHDLDEENNKPTESDGNIGTGEQEKDFVIMNMLFPPSLIEDLIKRGIIDPNDLLRTLDMIRGSDSLFDKNIDQRSFSDDFTGDESDRDDFGNMWTDWSSDLNDYI